MDSAGGIPGRKRAVKPQGGTRPKTIVCELGVGKTLYFILFEADSDPALMGQTSLKSDILSQGKEAESHTEKCRVSIIFCQGYRERKAVELKLTGIALNRSKNHIGERTTDRGLQVGFFLIKNTFAF